MNPLSRQPRRLPPFALLLALYTCGVRAEADSPTFSLSGFGTLGVAHSSERNADFTATTIKPNGAGYTHSWSFDVDSVIAAQVTANVTPELSAVLQVISEQNYDDTYDPQVEWANIQYEFTPDLSVRIGRTVLPIFMVADSRKVGYANPWVRPPPEVYRLVPVTSNDGIDVRFRMPVGEVINTLQVIAGRSDSKFPDGGSGSGTAKARELWAFVNTLEHGPATLRVNYGRGRLTISAFDSLFDAFRQFGPEGVAIANRFDVNGRLVTFYGVGAIYDPGDWFMMGEWSRINTDSVLGESTGWYTSGGRRFGKSTIYVTYADVGADNNTSDPGLNVSSLPSELVGPATGINAALNTIMGTKVIQHTFSVGGRWDFSKNAALKLQLDYSQLGADSAGTLSNFQPGFRPGGEVTVFSATIDFVL